MVTNYQWSHRKLFLNETELPLLSATANTWTYQHQSAELMIERVNKHTLQITLRNVKENLPTITSEEPDWLSQDYGQAVYNQVKGGYELIFGLPKIFYLLIDNYKGGSLEFSFDFFHHLVLKDKDDLKPYYWYQWDYPEGLSSFIYQKLSPFIKPSQGEIVAIPGEFGGSVRQWKDNRYFVNYFYCGYDPEKAGYDFSQETIEGWKKDNLPTSLVITYLPTSLENYQLPSGRKLTGTTWFKKVWQIWGSQGIPIILKCYRGFIFIHLFRNYPQLYQQISSITKLPASLNQRATGKSDLLVYFNMPFLSKNIPYKNYEQRRK